VYLLELKRVTASPGTECINAISIDTMNILLHSTREPYNAGGTVVLLFKGYSDEKVDKNVMIFVQVRGTWEQNTSWALKDSDSSTTNIFATSRIALSPTKLFEDGIYIEFELPGDALPSYKGPSGTIAYFVTLNIQESSKSQKKIFFPLTVVGTGSATPDYLKDFRNYSMADYAFQTVSSGGKLFSKPIGEQYLNHRVTSHLQVDMQKNAYNIRSGDDFICCLSMNGKAVLGTDIDIFADFSKCEVQCLAIRASIYLVEQRNDNLLLKDKSICSLMRSTTDAESINLVLTIPGEWPCEFKTPTFSVGYRLDMEFCVDLTTEAEREEASQQARGPSKSNTTPSPPTTSTLSFSIPLTVLPDEDDTETKLPSHLAGYAHVT
jgi:hypothetical protein